MDKLWNDLKSFIERLGAEGWLDADAALIWVGMRLFQSSFMNLTDIPTINAKMRFMKYFPFISSLVAALLDPLETVLYCGRFRAWPEIWQKKIARSRCQPN